MNEPTLMDAERLNSLAERIDNEAFDCFIETSFVETSISEAITLLKLRIKCMREAVGVLEGLGGQATVAKRASEVVRKSTHELKRAFKDLDT